MTYNQIVKTLTTLLQSHLQIRTVKNSSPKEWMFRDDNPVFPLCCFTILNGSLNIGEEQQYNIQFFFLDKSGAEAEFEQDVISDQLQIATDIVNTLRSGKQLYFIDDEITFNTITDKYEDYLAGVEITFNMTAQSDYSACDAPID